ncbi:MAG TPA: hypothetical protein DF613_12005 [Lachnospiraceae bacterium]|nr:hypothetical protein [Lachnospiraceae bacterium]
MAIGGSAGRGSVMKLQRKFLLIFLLISIAPVLIISFYTYTRYTSLIERQVTQSAENLLEVAAFHTNYTLANLEHIVESMYLPKENHTSMVDDLVKYTGNAQPDDHDIYLSNQKLDDVSQDFIYFSPYINGIFLFTPSGNSLGYGYGNGVHISHSYDPSGEDWYQETLRLQGDTYIYSDEKKAVFDGGSPSLSFCTALYDVHTRDFLGVLMIDCAPEIFDLSTVNTMPDMAALSVQSGDTPLYTTASGGLSGLKAENALSLEKTLDLPGLILHACVNREMLHREFGITQITLLSVTAICLLVFVTLSVLLSRSLTRPIIYLSRQMVRTDGKHGVVDSPYFHRQDEIGVLYNSFQEMQDEKDRYIKNELENKLILLDAQMRSLESQINAHFLYNTLEAINSIAAVHRIRDISTMALALGNMFRYSIKTQSELVPLERELDHVHDYIHIQQIRFDNAFSYEEHIPAGLRKRRVLKLILQPLVENALYHGLNYCRSGDTIVVEAGREGDLLLLSVTDNGQGIPTEKLSALQEQLEERPEFEELGRRNGQSIGIKNIHTRIALYYGEYYGLKVFSTKGAGTTIRITLPLYEE